MKKRTLESKTAGAPARRHLFISGLSLFFLLTATPRLFAVDTQKEIFAQRAKAAYDVAQARYQSSTNDPVLAWQFARTCYDWADWATNKEQRAAIAREGMAACRWSLVLTNSAAGHYYLALDMGQLAQAETLSALKLVHEMEGEFKDAADLDVNFDFGGADRGLGLLYRDAPGWPISIGNRHKAHEYLERALAIAPDYPENILNLAEAFLKWGDYMDAKKELDALDALWPRAQKDLSGPRWELSWVDWYSRRYAAREKLNQALPSHDRAR